MEKNDENQYNMVKDRDYKRQTSCLFTNVAEELN